MDVSAVFVVFDATLLANIPKADGYGLDGVDTVVQASEAVMPFTAFCVNELSVWLATDWRLIGTESVVAVPLLYFGRGLAIVLTAVTMSMRRMQIKSISRDRWLGSVVERG